MSRALGIKPYSTETEDEFLETLNHAVSNFDYIGSKYSVKKEVPISQVFQENPSYSDLFYKFVTLVYFKFYS